MEKIKVFGFENNKIVDLGEKSLDTVDKIELIDELSCFKIKFTDGSEGYIQSVIKTVNENGEVVTTKSEERIKLFNYLKNKKLEEEAKKNGTSVQVVAPVEGSDIVKKSEPVKVQTQEEVIEEAQKDKKVSWYKLPLGIVIGVVGAIAVGAALKSCGTPKEVAPISTSTDDKKEDKKTETSKTETPVVIKESRYTEITEENFNKTVEKFIIEAQKQGNIEITRDQAELFVILANLNHFEKTNPELLNEKLNGVSGEFLVQNAGEIIGPLVTNNYAMGKYPSFVTVAFMDETDKAIADSIFAIRDEIYEIDADYKEACKQINDDKTMTNSEKEAAFDRELAYARVDASEYFNGMYIEPFNSPSKTPYETSIGLVKTHQTDGAEFITTAIASGIFTSDPVIVQYVEEGLVKDSIVNMGKNAGTVPNIFTIVNRCQTTENTAGKTYQK